MQAIGQLTATLNAEFLILLIGRRGGNGEHCLADTGYADHCALAGHMFKELTAFGRLDPEGLNIRGFPTDVGDDAHMGNQRVMVKAGMAGTFMIVHH